MSANIIGSIEVILLVIEGCPEGLILVDNYKVLRLTNVSYY